MVLQDCLVVEIVWDAQEWVKAIGIGMLEGLSVFG